MSKKMSKDDEYTDFSCSTSVERLARDVEVLLRSWHVAGSDRHISFMKSSNRKLDSMHRSGSVPNLAVASEPRRRPRMTRSHTAYLKDSSSPPQEESPPSRQLEKIMKSVPRNGVLNRRGSQPHTSTTTDTTTTVMNDPSGNPDSSADSMVRLIRSDSISLTASFVNGAGRSTIPLIMSLWDGPCQKQPFEEDEFDIPLSLRRTHFEYMPSNLFSDFSTLFGIGQHITLAPSAAASDDILSADLISVLGKAVVELHGLETSPPSVLTGILSTILQTALNCAVSNCHCHIPVFGLWGKYKPSHDWVDTVDRESATILASSSRGNSANGNNHIFHTANQLFPSWITVDPALLGGAGTLFSFFPGWQSPFKKGSAQDGKKSFHPPSLTGNLVPPGTGDMTGARFMVSVLPANEQSSFNCSNFVFVWGRVFKEYCPPGTRNVDLWGARHKYTWMKVVPKRRTSILFDDGEDQELLWAWRNQTEKGDLNNNQSFEAYRLDCRRHALELLADASGSSQSDPLWGPADDPLSNVHVTTLWDGKRQDSEGKEVAPLLTLPLRIRSRHAMSNRDYIEMENATEHAVLDPVRASSFLVQAHYDRNTSLSSLAASQRCILAALIRTAVLHPDTLLPHLTNEAVLDEWSEEGVHAPMIDWLTGHAKIGHVTKGLVDAMNWSNAADDMIDEEEAVNIVHQVLNGETGLGYPDLPVGMPPTNLDDNLFYPMAKAAPVGRFLSLLFVRMSKLRSASSMALVWSAFARELRVRWDMRESLPNMSHNSGLDPPREVLKKTSFSTIGVKANLAAFVHSSESDPDEFHCLIGQKLQVFNIGIECATAVELLEIEKFEEDSSEEPDLEETAEFEDNEGQIGHPKSSPSASAGRRPSFASSGRSTPDFFDAMESRNDNSVVSGSPDLIGIQTGRRRTPPKATRKERKGARCPVHGINLIESSDQLYAPYLQRPFPLTDDIIVERRVMLSRRSTASGPASFKLDKRQRVQDRIEIAHRLQKTQLLSDMKAFKAANPSAVFQDFTSWYGNPGNPLDDYTGDTEASQQSRDRFPKSAAVKLDNASEAIQILTSIREFWADTWEEATACPAVKQQPLFDVFSTVERVLDYLETMHPAGLLNQVLSVNLSMSHFTLLASAGEAIHVSIVQAALEKLRVNIELALKLLSRDVTNGTCPALSDNAGFERLPKHASSEAIAACEVVCNSITDAEALLCRALSLLHKFPMQYDLVNKILRRTDGDMIQFDGKEGRMEILKAIQRNRSQEPADDEPIPQPSLREYLLRNRDESNPCQMCVRFGDKSTETGENDGRGGLLLALTKCSGD